MTEREIFAAALKKDSPSERQAFLEEACGSDTDLKNRIVSLLDAHGEAGSFLSASIGATSAADRVAEGPGAVIGRYKLLQQIGEGGMGVVFMAEQNECVISPAYRLGARESVKWTKRSTTVQDWL